MKNIVPLLFIVALVYATSCKEKTSERFDLLTSHAWTSDSLLADGVDAGGIGGLLEKFKGNIVFRVDGSGTFGQYTGTWMFVDNQTGLVIESPDLAVPLTTHIAELTSTSLKVTFTFTTLEGNKSIRMTFKPK